MKYKTKNIISDTIKKLYEIKKKNVNLVKNDFSNKNGKKRDNKKSQFRITY